MTLVGQLIVDPVRGEHIPAATVARILGRDVRTVISWIKDAKPAIGFWVNRGTMRDGRPIVRYYMYRDSFTLIRGKLR